MTKVKNYLSLIKFSHTIFAMPFALIGFFLALRELRNSITGAGNGEYQFLLPQGAAMDTMAVRFFKAYSLEKPTWPVVLLYLGLVILCMVFARSAAMAFNRYLDRRIDARNPRTAIREIPAGVISPRSALTFTIISSLLFITCTFFINRLCFYLSPVALAVILGYSYTKRFTPLCHLILGVGLSLAPIGAWLAVMGSFAWLPLIFSFVVITWVSGFDIIYALQDEAFDQSQQLYSIPAALGRKNALHVSELLHLLSAAGVLAAGWYGAFGWLYWIGAAVFSGMLLYQHAIVKPDDLRRVNLAFMTANGVASVVFAAFVIASLFIKI